MRTGIPDPLVLLVGLDSSVAAQVLSVLHGRGYRVELTGTGAGTLARYADNVPDLLILNETVSSQGERSFRTQRRSEPHLAQVPYLVITAGARPSDKERRRRARSGMAGDTASS